MKKLFVVALVMMFAIPCFAQDIITPKIAVTYNLDTEEEGEAIGGAVYEYKIGEKQTIDADILVESEVGDTLKSDEKTVIAGLSYNYRITDDFKAGVGYGASAIELTNGNIELNGKAQFIYGCISYKF